MATPTSTTSHEGRDSKKNHEQITFRFCSECSNMLYPKEDEDARKLQFTCRTCQYTEEATSSCVFRNVLNNAAGETAGVTQDVGSDPTVGVPSAPGPLISTPERPASGGGARKDTPMKVLFCLICGNDIICYKCGEHPAVLRSPIMAPQDQIAPASTGSAATDITTSSATATGTMTDISKAESLDELFASMEGVATDYSMEEPVEDGEEWDDIMYKGDRSSSKTPSKSPGKRSATI